MDRKELDAWLLAEERDDEDAADAAFAHVFSAVPKVEPRSMFVEEVVSAAWAWRARRRRRLALSWTTVAALVGVELVGILAFYALWRVAGAERLGDVQV